MKLLTPRRTRQTPLPGVTGPARLDSRAHNLTKRLRPGDIAIVDHLDLDRATAEAMIAAHVAGVVNVAPSISGRYPNLGPGALVSAGIPLVDNAGEDVFARVHEGDAVRLDGAALFRDGTQVAAGVRQTLASVTAATEDARAGLAAQLDAVAANAVEYLRRERDLHLLLDGVGIPPIQSELDGRHVLIVVGTGRERDDLRSLRSYIRDFQPVLVGVDAGADSLLAAGLVPDLIVGDMESVSEVALRRAAELVVHVPVARHAPGVERLQRLGLDAHVLSASGADEDLAILLAEAKGAELIVTAGLRTSLIECLDKGRSGMASMILTRVKVGGKLVDADSASQLHAAAGRIWPPVLLLVAGLIALLVTFALTPVGSALLASLETSVPGLFGPSSTGTEPGHGAGP
jgi:uncharacterized membrane-anchored protein